MVFKDVLGGKSKQRGSTVGFFFPQFHSDLGKNRGGVGRFLGWF